MVSQLSSVSVWRTHVLCSYVRVWMPCANYAPWFKAPPVSVRLLATQSPKYTIKMEKKQPKYTTEMETESSVAIFLHILFIIGRFSPSIIRLIARIRARRLCIRFVLLWKPPPHNNISRAVAICRRSHSFIRFIWFLSLCFFHFLLFFFFWPFRNYLFSNSTEYSIKWMH